MRLFLEFSGPLDLGHTLECGQAFRWRPAPLPLGIPRTACPAAASSQEGGSFWFTGTVGSVAMMVRWTGKGLEIRSNPTVSKEFVYSYFRLDDPLDRILDAISKDRHVRRAARLYRGLRLLRQDPWECLVSFVSSIASNVPKIARCIHMMSVAHGKKLRLDGVDFYGFPSPEALSRAGERALRKCELGFRARYIAGIARTVAAGDFELASIRARPYSEAKKELLKLKGVGEKVADCVLLFSGDKLEAFPVDRWVRRVAEKYFFRGRRLSEKQVREWGSRHYGRYAGYAQQYLFHYIRHL